MSEKPFRSLDFDDRYIPEPNSGCWLWLGKLQGGYGRHKGMTAHRHSYQKHKGPIVSGLWVLHKCDVRCCVNPDHLYLGTLADNTADAMRRDRLHRWKGMRRGLGNPKAMLSEEQVIEILSLYKGGHSTPEIAKRYPVCRAAVWDIVGGRTWKHIPRSNR